jgi:hypothetical protein
MAFYSFFGLCLQTDDPIPGISPLAGACEADVGVCLQGFPAWLGNLIESGAVPWRSGNIFDQAGEPTLRVWRVGQGAFFWLKYNDGIEFVVDRAGTRIWARGPVEATPEDIIVYLLGPILGFVLRLQGVTCLHASAMAAGDTALALVGPSGAGKSTSAAAFARLGYPVLTDDILALREKGETFWALPGLPRLSLWPEAVSCLFGSPDALPRITPEDTIDPEWNKRRLDLTAPGYQFQFRPLPLRVIYLLQDRTIDHPPAITGVSTAEGMMALVANTYRTDLLDKTMRAQEFETLSRLVARVPFRQVSAQDDAACLPRFCEAILEDFQALTAVETQQAIV